jgi:hypothetical protein
MVLSTYTGATEDVEEIPCYKHYIHQAMFQRDFTRKIWQTVS